MNLPLSAVLALAISAAGLAFFLFRYVQLKRSYRSMTALEQRYAEIQDVRHQSVKVPLRDRVRAELRRVGLSDDLFPFFFLAGVLYLASAVALSFVNLPQVVTLLAALPVTVGLAWGVIAMRAQRRRAAFNRQLVDLLDLVTGQVKGGVGAEAALAIVVPQLPEPIREEMSRALAAGQAGRDLVSAMEELGERFPSRAFDMFISALEIDRAAGHAIAPALRQASDLLKRDFALASEARSEIAQARYEFLGVLGIVVAMCAYLVLGEDTKDSFRTPGGVIVIILALTNVAIGVFRFSRMLQKIKGDT